MPYTRNDSPFRWVSFTEPSGKRIRRSTGTTDRKEAEALEAKWKLESYRSKQWDEQPTRSFEELMVSYLKATEGQKRSGDTDRYRVRALRRHFQGRIVHELTRADIRDYVTARRSDGVTNSTINPDLALLSSAIGYANSEWDWRLPNPVSGRKLPEPEGRVLWITMDEARGSWLQPGTLDGLGFLPISSRLRSTPDVAKRNFSGSSGRVSTCSAV